MTGQTPMQSGFSRVWMIEGRARPDHAPKFQSCMAMGAPSYPFGEPEPIRCPDPTQYGGFVVGGQVQPPQENATAELMGRYALELESDLLRLGRRKCAVDVQAHMGRCEDPMQFNTGFRKILVLEDAKITEWGADEVGSLEEGSAVNETSPLSATEMYEILPLTITAKGGDTVVNALIDIVRCDRVSCGDCDDESDGCSKFYALTQASAGSPGTAADVLAIVKNSDGSYTLTVDEINSLDASEEPNALACLGEYVVVVSNDSDSLHYKLKSDIDAGVVGGWTENATGFVAAGSPNDIWSTGTRAFVVGDGGYVYVTDDPTSGVTVVDAGIATSNNLQAVHALSDDFAVAVGDTDTIIHTENAGDWTADTATGGGNGLLCVWIKSEDEWWTGDDAGNLYYTLTGGTAWTAKGIPGTPTAIRDFQFATDSVAYAVGNNVTPIGQGWRSYNGGYSFRAMPEGPGSLTGSSVQLNALATCGYADPNYVAMVGTVGTPATDGVLLIGDNADS